MVVVVVVVFVIVVVVLVSGSGCGSCSTVDAANLAPVSVDQQREYPAPSV